MSGANAIHGIILLGAILVTGTTDNTVALVVGLVAIVLAAVNMVGGFVVTDRMLQMFSRRRPTSQGPAGQAGRPAGASGRSADADLGPARLPALRGRLHPRAQGTLGSADRPDRQPRRRGLGGRRLRVAVRLPRPRPRPAHPGGDRRRDGR